MNNGAFGENFPYSNFHDLNMDWIIKIAKDFLDQYTHIQQIIEEGEQSILNKTADGIEQLETKANELTELLDQWYTTHSEDIANQLASALSELNAWYTEHQDFLDQYVTTEITNFQTQARAYGDEVIDSIPDDYTELSNTVKAINREQDIFNESYYVNLNKGHTGVLSASYTDDGKYITEYDNVGSYALAQIRYYPIVAGKVYRIWGVAKLLEYPTFGLTEDYTLQTFTETWNTPATREYYNTDTFFKSNITGYLAISELKESITEGRYLQITELDITQAIKYYSLEAGLKNSFTPIRNTIKAQTFVETKSFIDTDGDIDIGNVGNDKFVVNWYAVNKGETIVLSGTAKLVGTTYPVAVFGKTKRYYDEVIIDGSHGANLYQYNVPFTAPENGFVAVSQFNDTGYGSVLCYTPLYNANNGISKKTLKVQAFGDSQTDNEHNTWAGHTTWLDYYQDVQEPHYSLSITNSAYGGASLTLQNQYSVFNRVQNLLDTSSDIIIIWAGTNDWAGSLAQIGNIPDGNNSTIKGALSNIIKYISDRSEAQIIVATPTQRYNSVDQTRPVNANGEALNELNLTLKDVCNAMNEVCDFYGIPCLRFDNMAGFNTHNITYFSSDGLHISTPKGNSRIASMFIEEINRYFFN